ncbi:MAG: M28 family peptidase [Candidatus Krumholzibacteriaceae bacterium]|jgi:hypothetical protein
MKRLFSVLFALLILAGPAALRSADVGKDALAASRSILPMDAYDICKKISSPGFAGRLTGDEGFTGAAKWAASRFKEWGLGPLGAEGGYLQAFPSPYTIVDKAEMTLLIRAGGAAGGSAGGAAKGAAGSAATGAAAGAPFRELKLRVGDDFMPLLFSASGDTTAGLVFAGWGISAPALGYDDYQGLDPAGKFVLCFRGTPDRDNLAYEDYDQHRTRLATAKAKGALGLIYIYDRPNAHPNGDWIDAFTPAMISERSADSLFAEKGLTCAKIRDDLGRSKKPESFALGSRVHYRVRSRHYAQGVGYNVAGWIEGSDPKLKDECIVIGAHLDHCGSHMGMIFTGADDNASGSSVVMAIAHAYSTCPVKPKRSIVFVLFGGEEEGLVGSMYYAAHMPGRFTKVAGMFNYDMVGEGEGAGCGYTPQSPELLAALKDADSYVKTLRDTWEIKHVGVRSSDFAPFFQKGAPCVACSSNGPHFGYHETGDTIYRINPDILADIARLGFLASYEWADR